METIATIAVIIVIVIIVKFVYDTFITDNTDKRFEEYRSSDPIGAAEIDHQKQKKNSRNLWMLLVPKKEER